MTLSSVAVEVIAVLPKTNCPSGTTALAAPTSVKSSSLSSHNIYAPEVAPKYLTSCPVLSTPTVTAPFTNNASAVA